MKTETYKKGNNEQGQNLWLEAGDKVKCLDETPRKVTFEGALYPNYSLQVELDGKKTFIRLTEGQYKRLSGLAKSDGIKGKFITATEYEWTNPQTKEVKKNVGVQL